jgi:hypothetical protein
VIRRDEDSIGGLPNQLRNKAKEFESSCLALDEGDDTKDTAQVINRHFMHKRIF